VITGVTLFAERRAYKIWLRSRAKSTGTLPK
jgi:hypothetical protein